MKKRRIYALVVGCIVVIAAAGLRIGIGQGNSDPIVLPAGAKASTALSQRTLEVRLTNRKTGRPQHYEWSLAVPSGGSVEIECHEWMHVHFFGVSMFGAPRNSFRRIVSLDSVEDGVAEPYDYVVRCRTKKGLTRRQSQRRD
jgi:hypothetical protein